MKIRSSTGLVLAVAAWALAASPSIAQQSRSEQTPGEDVLLEIRSALARGHARGLILRSGERLDITVFGASEVLSRSQAKYVMLDFFREYRPTRLDLEETSGSDGNWFASARYWAQNEEDPFAVYLRLRRSERGWELRELRIGRSNSK